MVRLPQPTTRAPLKQGGSGRNVIVSQQTSSPSKQPASSAEPDPVAGASDPALLDHDRPTTPLDLLLRQQAAAADERPATPALEQLLERQYEAWSQAAETTVEFPEPPPNEALQALKANPRLEPWFASECEGSEPCPAPALEELMLNQASASQQDADLADDEAPQCGALQQLLASQPAIPFFGDRPATPALQQLLMRTAGGGDETAGEASDAIPSLPLIT